MTRLFASVALVATLFAAPAFAQTLSLKDLDFSKPADLAAFQSRVEAIENQLCSGRVETGTRIGAEASCRKGVREEVMEKLSARQRRAYAEAQKAAKPATETAAAAGDRG